MMRRLIFRPSTTASKLGSVIVGSVQADLLEESCQGCSHFTRRRKGGRSCYAWRGHSLMAYRSMTKAIARRQAAAGTDETPPAYTLRGAIAARRWDARYVRLTMIGDASVCTDIELADVKAQAEAAGLDVLGYTAHWATRGQDRPVMRGMLLASTQTDTATDAAHRSGWVVAQTVDAQRFAEALPAGHITTDGGQRLALCPHQSATLSVRLPPTCNDCGLCAVKNMRSSGFDGVAFASHGPTPHGRAWTRLVKAARAAISPTPTPTQTQTPTTEQAQ